MNEFWFDRFAPVCGQNPEHTWTPGGIPLPFCQRCTGLYVGILAATWLHLVLRPRLTGRFLWAHGSLLVVMAPFGFHWVAHGPGVRSITGVLFGFGVATFLWAGIASTGRWSRMPSPGAACRYAILLVGVALAVPLLGAWGGAWAAGWLTGLAGLGLLAVVCLTAASACIGGRSLWRRVGNGWLGSGLLRGGRPHTAGRERCTQTAEHQTACPAPTQAGSSS